MDITTTDPKELLKIINSLSKEVELLKLNMPKILYCTKAYYDSLKIKDKNTFYVINP